MPLERILLICAIALRMKKRLTIEDGLIKSFMNERSFFYNTEQAWGLSTDIMKPTGKHRQGTSRSQDMQTLILKTALTLFTENGYFNTSVHDIRKQADVSIGSIYNYFKNKEAIAQVLYRDLLGHMEQAMVDIRCNHQRLHDRCRAIVEYLFEMTENTPGKMQYLLYAVHKEFMPQEKSVCSSRPFEMIREMIKEGIENSEIRQLDTEVAGACLLGSAIRLIRVYLDGVLEQPLSHYLDDIWECSWKSVSK
jgi:AcrR family transcriptional regulator